VRTTVSIDAIAPGGEGVAREGAPAVPGDRPRPVFVPFTAPGDLVEVEAPPGEGALHAELLRLVSGGPDRVPPPCRHFGPAPRATGDPEARALPAPDRLCGGCEWLHLAYPAQLAAKERNFFEALRRIGRLDPGSCGARPIVASPDPLRYRSRAKFHFDRASGRLAFYRRRSHEPVRLAECWLLSAPLDALRERTAAALADARLEVREVTLEWSDHEVLGAAALKLAALTPAARARAEGLLAAVPALKGLVLAADGAAPATLGDPVLLHARRPGDPAAGLQRSRPDVFAQANRGANGLLVELATGLLGADGGEVLELYCGAGNFTAALARRARRVHAVEVEGPALELARRDLGGAGAGGAVRFYAGDSLRLALAFARERTGAAPRFDAVLLDPPREGAKGIATALRDLGAPRCAYVSCDPATLARDVRACVEAGYRVAAAQPVDLFPQTHHVEGVVLLERA
jgi:23S rRNA (uracil1939-C5)-methyltransferase